MDKASEPIVIPICYNKTGHPLLLSQSLFDRVVEYGGSGGIGGALSGADADTRDAGYLKLSAPLFVQ